MAKTKVEEVKLESLDEALTVEENKVEEVKDLPIKEVQAGNYNVKRTREGSLS